MATPSTTPSPTLPTDWVPAEPNCLRADDYWIWDYDAAARDARTVLGGPPQTTDCFASAWKPTVTFAGSACPTQYTAACSNADSGAVTCCPSAHEFICETDIANTTIHADWFRCVSQYDSGGTMRLTRTDFKAQTVNTGTRTRHTNEHLFALALMYTTPPTTIPSSTTSLPTTSSQSQPTTPSSSSSSSSSSGLGAGAAAGLGVGVAAGVILVSLLAWFLYRRRRAARASSSSLSNETPQFYAPPPPPPPPPSTVPSTPMVSSMTTTPRAPSMAPTQVTYATSGPRGPSQPPIEPLAGLPPKELPSNEELRYELHGDSNTYHSPDIRR